MCKKRSQHDHYSTTAITLRYIYALSQNASTLWRKVIAFQSYRSRLMEIVIAFYSYRSRLIGNVIAFIVMALIT
jgi:hypothetical protein